MTPLYKGSETAACVCVCVSVKGWRKLYSLTGDHFSGQSWFYRLYWCWSVCLPVVIPQAALCTVWFMHVLNSNKTYRDSDPLPSVTLSIVKLCHIKFIFYYNWITDLTSVRRYDQKYVSLYAFFLFLVKNKNVVVSRYISCCFLVVVFFMAGPLYKLTVVYFTVRST